MEPRRGGRRPGRARGPRGPGPACAAYWYPLYAFIRRKGHGPDAALDLTQEYFTGLLERGTVAAADPGKGRFRSFLLADCSHFLAHRREHDRALKRGGGIAPLSIDARDAEGRYVLEPSHSRTPEHLFERDWALAMLEGVLARLRVEYHDAGRGEVFEVLKVGASEVPRSIPQAELAARLGISEGAVQVAVHRLRKRYLAGPRSDRRDGRRRGRSGRRDPRAVRGPGVLKRKNPADPVWLHRRSGRDV